MPDTRASASTSTSSKRRFSETTNGRGGGGGGGGGARGTAGRDDRTRDNKRERRTHSRNNNNNNGNTAAAAADDDDDEQHHRGDPGPERGLRRSRRQVRSLIAVVGGGSPSSPTAEGAASSASSPATSSVAADAAPSAASSSEKKSPRGATAASPGSPASPASSSDTTSRARNRRIFGGLMGHLARSASELNSEKWQERLAKKSKKEAAALEKQQEVNRRLREKMIEDAKQARIEAAKVAVRREKEESAERMREMAKQWIQHQKRLGEFLTTSKAKPQLLWRPSKATIITDKMFEDRRQVVAQLCKEKEAKVDRAVAELLEESSLPDSDTANPKENEQSDEEHGGRDGDSAAVRHKQTEHGDLRTLIADRKPKSSDDDHAEKEKRGADREMTGEIEKQ